LRLRLALILFCSQAAWAQAESAIQPADTAWMMICTAMVLLMTPALGFFYSGMTRSKNALNTLMMSVAALGVAGLVWVLLGYSLAFSPSGGLEFAGLQGVDLEPKGKIPHLLFMAYQATFAVITAALVSGAIVERMRFSAYLCFIGLWTLLVYSPFAHWVWGGGWLATLGALDYAGGTVVHINAGISALVLAMYLGPRKEFGRMATVPHHVPSVLLGAALLWFGWFGFNAGSALEANKAAVLAFVNTMLSPMASLATWMALDYLRTKQMTAIGAATGLVVGLVAITPAAGFVSPLSALLMGFLATFPSYYAILLRHRFRVDDTLDAFAGHGVGGITGALLTGVFAQAAWGGTNGLLYGNPKQFAVQACAVLAAAAYSGLLSFGILFGLSKVMALRVSPREEGRGLDVTQHGEEAYSENEGILLLPPPEKMLVVANSAPVVRVAEGLPA
jgi:Amt family ammonium transporter